MFDYVFITGRVNCFKLCLTIIIFKAKFNFYFADSLSLEIILPGILKTFCNCTEEVIRQIMHISKINHLQEIQEEEAIGWYAKYSDALKAVENAKKSEHANTLAR